MKKNFARPARVTAIALLFVAVFWCANVLFAKLPLADRALDISEGQMTALSQPSAELVRGLDRDVTISVVAPDLATDIWRDPLLSRYQKMNNHIHIAQVAADSEKALSYDSNGLAAGSLIVESDLRGTSIAAGSLYAQKMDYYTGTQQTTASLMEQKLTEAIEYATRTDMPVVYALSGHNETELTGAMASALAEADVDLKPLSLSSGSAVPSDAACMLIAGPQTDLTSGEASAILTYLAGGGHVLLFTDLYQADLPQLWAVVEQYGMKARPGLVLEGDPSKLLSSSDQSKTYPQYVPATPSAAEHPILTAIADAKATVLMPLSHAIEKSDATLTGLKVTDLLMSGDQSYLKTDIKALKSTDRAAEDATGPFVLAAVAEAPTSNGTAQIVWFASSRFPVDSAANQAVSGGNAATMVAVLHTLAGEVSAVQVAERSMATGGLTFYEWPVIPTVVILGLPILALLGWAVTAFIRRRRSNLAMRITRQ